MKSRLNNQEILSGTGGIHPLVLEFCKRHELHLKEPRLLMQALTHPTYAFEFSKGEGDYERLEFLGDAVLELAVSDLLFKRSKNLAEGQMTKIRASLVCEDSLAILAQEIDLGSYLLLGHGEEMTGGRQKKSNLANAYEALLAAFYLNWGFQATLEWLEKKIDHLLELALAGDLHSDYKSRLLELAQNKHQLEYLQFKVRQIAGPVHNPLFKASIFFHGAKLAEGEGGSKKQAEQAAAKAALEQPDLFLS